MCLLVPKYTNAADVIKAGNLFKSKVDTKWHSPPWQKRRPLHVCMSYLPHLAWADEKEERRVVPE